MKRYKVQTNPDRTLVGEFATVLEAVEAARRYTFEQNRTTTVIDLTKEGLNDEGLVEIFYAQKRARK